MQKYLPLLLILLPSISLFSQSKYDHTWLMGYSGDEPGVLNGEYNGGMKIHFNDKSINIEEFDFTSLTFGITGCINDPGGHLAFYTSGCNIYNRNHEIMENGQDIIIGGENAENRCEKYEAILNLLSSTVILPIPEQAGKYINFQLRLEETTDTTYVEDKYFYAIVDMNENNGLGRVIDKHQVVLDDSLHDAVAAVRHGNGRDWWVVVPRGTERQFWELLVTPEGVKDKILRTLPPQKKFDITYKELDPPFTEHLYPEYMFECFGGQATFSPDGTKYARIVFGNGVEIFDFDRCTGAMTLRRTIPMPPDSIYESVELPIQYTGLAISPNSRFLYFNNNHGLFQFDLCEENIESGDYVKIGYMDGFYDPHFPVPLNFFQMRNTPNGKIFMTPANGSRYIHVIHEPDKGGKDCDFRLHDIELPKFNYVMSNYFPNFNLYDVKDSPCDTLGIDDPNPPVPLPDFSAITFYPNPANDLLNIFVPNCDEAQLTVYNAPGQLIISNKRITGKEVVSVSTKEWPAGTYVFHLRFNDGAPLVKKVVIGH